MKEIIAKLYDKAIVIEDGGDYVCGELDPMKFAELIIRECIDVAFHSGHPDLEFLLKHFGVSDE
jgi:hypothetical protein